MHFFMLLALVASILSANHISWYGNFDKAHKEAVRQDKLLMVLLVKKDCNFCKDTMKRTFLNKPYIEKINDKFISVIVTKNQKASYPIEMLYTFTYPTLFFLDKNELLVNEPIRGDVTPDKLKSYLEEF